MKLPLSILLPLLLAFGGSTLASAAPDAIQAGPHIAIATTQSGAVQGFVHNAILTYRGIPYATAERFMPPQPLPKWADTKMALLYGNICPQSASNPLANFLFSGPHLQQSDDCQNLNIVVVGASQTTNHGLLWCGCMVAAFMPVQPSKVTLMTAKT